MKAETIRRAGQWLETDDGFLVDIDAEEAPLDSDGDVVVTAIGTDGGGQHVRLVGEHGTALDTTLPPERVEGAAALVPGKRIVQEWTTTEWPEGAPPSTLDVTLETAKDGTLLRMVHSEVPASQAASYRQGWIDYYWTPLQKYFSKKGPT